MQIEQNNEQIPHLKKQEIVDDDKQDIDNPVWEELSPLIWRDSIYSDAMRNTPMGQLFVDEIKLFQEVRAELKDTYEKFAIIEVGMGTAELFSKITDSYDMLVGVEISQQMINFAYQIHDNLR